MTLPIYDDAPTKPSFDRSHYLLEVTIKNLFLRYSVRRVLFITLTFRYPVTSPARARKRLNSFLNKFRKRYCSFIRVLGCHKNGGIHYHLLIPVSFDCHDNTRITAWSGALNDSSSKRDRELLDAMSPALRAESDWWTRTSPRYGFGRVQVAPIHSNAEAVRKYLLKQAPFLGQLGLGDTRYVHFWACSQNLKSGSIKFAWNSPGTAKGRARLKEWAAEQGCNSYEDLRAQFGSRWGWHYIQWCERQHATT